MLILWDGQHRDHIRYMRGAEYQARDKHRAQEYTEEYEFQGWDSRSPTPAPAMMSSPAPAATSALATASAPAPATMSAPAPVADATSAPASVPPVQTPQVVVIPATPESSQEQINNLNQVGHLSVPQPLPPPVRGHNFRPPSLEYSRITTPNIFRHCETPYVPPHRRRSHNPSPEYSRTPTPSPSSS